MWTANENWLTHISFVHLRDIDSVKKLNVWKDNFINKNADDWCNEGWAEISKNEIIQKAMDLYKNDIENIDNEMFEVVFTYFDNILKIKW